MTVVAAGLGRRQNFSERVGAAVAVVEVFAAEAQGCKAVNAFYDI